MRVYVSSTFEDLEAHRQEAQRILRQLGHEVVAMETYVAGDLIPLKKVLADVKECDLYVGIFAWRYGYVPETGPRLKGAKPGSTSISEYEYRQAIASKKPTLIFLADERAAWPMHHVDREPVAASAIGELRAELQREKLVAYFSTPDQLAARVSAAVSTAGMRRELRDRLISPVGASLLQTFTAHDYLSDSYTMPILDLVSARQPPKAAVIDIGTRWWSTRLFLLAALGQMLGRLERILIFDEGRFVGLVSTGTVRIGLGRVHSEAAAWEKRVLRRTPIPDVRAVAEGYLEEWNVVLKADPGDSSPERRVALEVSVPNLRLWFGEAFQETLVSIEDLTSASAIDLLRILDYPNEFVPVGRASAAGNQIPDDGNTKPAAGSRNNSDEVVLVDKRELTNRLARSAVSEMLDRVRVL